ncbi:anthranilate synthase component I [Waterburya agarophytonicola K14]|uniref:Anthranilate synthase component 1 n=1 Tax=Waterburya agarophytonicola KI4 TaxID=2874699 RepID=A0A964BQF1_9CYAN|nr:anthranilate synthase component I [Waterburya agarophytonicola KI4]
MTEATKSWYWRSLPLANRTASEVFSTLFGDQDIATLLESPTIADPEYPHLSRYSICGGCPRKVDGKAQIWTPAMGEILPFLRSLLKRSLAENPIENPDIAHLPFTGGWLGWLGYDLAWEIESLPKLNQDDLPFPVAYWYEPECFAVLDHLKNILWLATTNPDQLNDLETRLLAQSPSPYGKRYPLGQIPKSSINFLTDREQYQNSVKQAQKYIQAGDIFQTNLSLRFQTQTNRDSWSIYSQLQQINPSPFASYWKSPWGDIISCSPERLVKLEGSQAQTRPIAGTRRRGTDRKSDRALATELLANTKERAEHIMLVDLERNDLGRVCQWGSVEVDELLVIERYSHVMHLVSNVKGILQSDRDTIDLIRGVFPGGTITGCPKVRCMEIIEELEPTRRSLFYGSCGYLDCRGNLDLNILIRTLLYVPSADAKLALVYGQVGAGIVADSDPEKEWYESLNKAEAQIAALQFATNH